ncbi:MAG TPA: hypothetical protein VEO94_07520 [Candidatus Dormibacteraeota bacterium]|nr:hypothetical protein [Candidatus Dormibacteraeota bacterium]
MAVIVAACQKSDVVAPDGATIALTANPATVLLSGGVQSDPVEIVATVSNSIGVPLSGQDVRFTTTAGTLTPPAGDPVRTDRFGNATTILTEARQPPTITAKSGKASQTLALQTATCTLSSIGLGPNVLDLNTCNDTFDMTATATDTSGAPCPGLLVTFAIGTVNSSTDVTLIIPAPSQITDIDGNATATVDVSATDCNSKCVGPQKTCTGGITASSGSITSALRQIIDHIQ